MKKALFILTVIAVMPLTGYAGSNDAGKGVQLYRQHHYQDAARLMYAQLAAGTSGLPSDTRRNFGMACLANAQFYDRLYQAAGSLQVEYLKRLIDADAQRQSSTSRLAQLFLGKALLADGQPKPAIAALSQYLETVPSDDTDRHDAAIALGAAYHAAGQHKRAKDVWSRIPRNVPHAAALLAAAFQQAGRNAEEITRLADYAAAELLTAADPVPVECASALLEIYARRNQVNEGFEILTRTRLETFAREEVIGPYKVLRFYDAGLLRNLSRFYSQAAITAFNDAKKSNDDRIALTAAFLAGEAYAFSQRMEEATRAMDELLAATPPKTLSQRARIRQAAYGRNTPARHAAGADLDTFLTDTIDVAQVADIILLCAQMGVDCPGALKRADMIWQKSQGRPPLGLGMALGRYYRARNNPDRALHYLEAARDKSRKNRIEANPPAMLADLAWAYYKNRQFSEALEIYFTMSKQFPAVRQIQVALQGIYSMEQQSAGDAKIF